jgi:hypothetical protein
MLPDSVRAGLRSHLDVTALEELLARVSDSDRARVLAFFSRPRSAAVTESLNEESTSVSMPQPVFEDAVTSALFDRVTEPLRLVQRRDRLRLFPSYWHNLERRFEIIAPLHEPAGLNSRALIRRRPADAGGDSITLPPALTDAQSLLRRFASSKGGRLAVLCMSGCLVRRDRRGGRVGLVRGLSSVSRSSRKRELSGTQELSFGDATSQGPSRRC